MTRHAQRRLFLKQTSVVSATVLAAQKFVTPTWGMAAEDKTKLNCVVIGCGARGATHIATAVGQNLVALVDVDENRLLNAQKLAETKGVKLSRVQTFHDYRTMFDKIGQQIDVVSSLRRIINMPCLPPLPCK